MELQTTLPAAPPDGASIPDSASHLRYLDGIRGLAALYVLVHHIGIAGENLANQPGAFRRNVEMFQYALLTYGHFAVGVFIVLSGYCLMLPVARSRDGLLKGGIRGYFKRRSRRILPPYFGALAAVLLATGLLPRAHMPSAGAVISHIFLVHNLSPVWSESIDGPMWSVAVEWQIYFIFALLLLPLWRRLGRASVLVIALLIGLAPHYLLPPSVNLDWSFPWYVTLFAMGMCAATLAPLPTPRAARSVMPWGSLAFALSLLFFAAHFSQRQAWAQVRWIYWLRQENWGSVWPLDLLAGAATTCALISLTYTSMTAGPRKRGMLLSTLESRPLERLGAFSYSLYLIHLPVVHALFVVLRDSHLSPPLAYAAMFGLGLPFGLCAGCALYLLIERHCISPSGGSRPVALTRQCNSMAQL